MKNKSFKEQESLRDRGTRKYIERIIEEKEAEQEIKEYEPEEYDYEDRIQNDVRPERI